MPLLLWVPLRTDLSKCLYLNITDTNLRDLTVHTSLPDPFCERSADWFGNNNFLFSVDWKCSVCYCTLPCLMRVLVTVTVWTFSLSMGFAGSHLWRWWYSPSVYKIIRKLLPNTDILCRIVLRAHVTVVTGEWSFSRWRIIKNYLRTTMAQEWMGGWPFCPLKRSSIQLWLQWLHRWVCSKETEEGGFPARSAVVMGTLFKSMCIWNNYYNLK